jgi:hypothetical protein
VSADRKNRFGTDFFDKYIYRRQQNIKFFFNKAENFFIIITSDEKRRIPAANQSDLMQYVFWFLFNPGITEG